MIASKVKGSINLKTEIHTKAYGRIVNLTEEGFSLLIQRMVKRCMKESLRMVRSMEWAAINMLMAVNTMVSGN